MAPAATERIKLCLSLREHFGGIMQIFPHCDINMWGRVRTSRFRFLAIFLKKIYEEYLFGFETLVFATYQELVTLQKERKNLNHII